MPCATSRAPRGASSVTCCTCTRGRAIVPPRTKKIPSCPGRSNVTVHPLAGTPSGTDGCWGAAASGSGAAGSGAAGSGAGCRATVRGTEGTFSCSSALRCTSVP